MASTQSAVLTSTGLRLRPVRDHADEFPAVYEVVGLPPGGEAVVATVDRGRSWRLLTVSDDDSGWVKGFQTPEAALLFLHERVAGRSSTAQGACCL